MDFKKILDKVLKGLKWFFFSYIWLFVVFFIVDIVTKQAIVKYFATHNDPIVLIKGFLRINYSINEGAAFGFGLDNAVANRVVYCVVAFIGLSLLVGVYVWKFKKLDGITRATLMLMCVGALGNLVDRVFYSPEFLHVSNNGVVDWIDFYGVWPFIFNIADSCIVIGVLILIVYLIVDEVKVMRERRKKEIVEVGGKVLSKEEKARLAETEDKKEESEEKPEEPQQEVSKE